MAREVRMPTWDQMKARMAVSAIQNAAAAWKECAQIDVKLPTGPMRCLLAAAVMETEEPVALALLSDGRAWSFKIIEDEGDIPAPRDGDQSIRKAFLSALEEAAKYKAEGEPA